MTSFHLWRWFHESWTLHHQKYTKSLTLLHKLLNISLTKFNYSAFLCVNICLHIIVHSKRKKIGKQLFCWLNAFSSKFKICMKARKKINNVVSGAKCNHKKKLSFLNPNIKPMCTYLKRTILFHYTSNNKILKFKLLQIYNIKFTFIF